MVPFGEISATDQHGDGGGEEHGAPEQGRPDGTALAHRPARKVPCMSAPIFKNAEMCEEISRPENGPTAPHPSSGAAAAGAPGALPGTSPRPVGARRLRVELPAPPSSPQCVHTAQRECRLFGRLSFCDQNGI